VQPYVIKQGDYLAALAHKFDFDADSIWNHDKNADLREARPNPNILSPTDMLYIPDQVDKEPNWLALTTGTTNTFVSDAPTVTITIRFADDDLANQAYTVVELPDLTGLTTGDDGTASFPILVTLASFTIEFTRSGATFPIFVGHLDPIDTLSGVAQRLQNLGYLGSQPDDGQLDVNAVRAGLRLFKAHQQDDGAPDSSGDGEDAQDDGDEDDGSSSSDDGAGDSGDDDSAGDDPDDDDSGDEDDDAGLSDEGTLDEETAKLLLTAYGS
jgi:N-acetylmuramoyl-L-alanine amidase